MARRNRNKKQKNKLTGRQRLQSFTKNADITEYKGIEFTFEDEKLQEEYIQQRNKYEKLEINFIEPVTYVDAKSLIGGKMKQRMDNLLDKYDDRDNRYSSGLRDKYALYDKVREEYKDSTPNEQIDKINKLFDMVAKETERWNEQHKKNNGQQKYNIVYYTQSDHASKSPV